MNYQREFTVRIKDLQFFRQDVMLEKWKTLITGCGLLGAVVAWGYLQWAGQEMGIIGEVITTVFAGLASLEVLMLGLIWFNNNKVKSTMRRMGKSSYHQSVEIDGFGVHAESDGKKEKAGFDKIVRVKETVRAFYIFYAQEKAWILPKDQMADVEAESAKLREIFTALVASSQLKLMKK